MATITYNNHIALVRRHVIALSDGAGEVIAATPDACRQIYSRSRTGLLRIVGLALTITLLLFTAACSSLNEPSTGEHLTVAASDIHVDRLTFPVTLSDKNGYEMVGYYYHSAGESTNRPLQVLVHGAGYDHRYWDAGAVDGVDYSYARYMVTQGFDVLAVDLLGAGESSKPDGHFLGLDQTANGLHQVLASLRAKDKNSAPREFRRIALVGHSNGSLTAIHEESLNHLADAMVVTGWGHTAVPLPVDNSVFDPLLTTPYVPSSAFSEETRGFLFYHQPSANPVVIKYDAATLAASLATQQFKDLLAAKATPLTDGVAKVKGPVLVQFGDHDVIAPAVNAPREQSHWTHASPFAVQTLKEMGHDVNLHRNHMESWSRISAWLHDKLGK